MSRELAARVLESCRRAGLRLACAESCTGGLVAAELTAIAGSSDVVERGFVTYSNQAKADMLGIPLPLIERFGAVSPDVAVAMAEGAVKNSRAQIAVSITGIAGPGGGSPEKPVGTVHFALARAGKPTRHVSRRFEGDRDAVRQAAKLQALTLLLEGAEDG